MEHPRHRQVGSAAGPRAPAGERHFDLAFVPYRPLRPSAGKASGDALLWAALDAAGERARWEPLLRAIQRGVGRGRTIWGCSRGDAGTTWRLRLANPARERLVDALRGELGTALTIAPGLADDGAYDVLGIDLSPTVAAAGRVDAVTHYRRGDAPRTLTVEAVDAGGRRPAGDVLIVEAKREIGVALPRIKASRVVDFAGDRSRLGRALIPELFACRHLHVCRRGDVDALVYSGINVDHLLWFLARFAFPPALVDFARGERERLDHLLFDVEVAYRQSGAAIVYPETTLYGAL
ncbi:MAG: hypothetical protein R3A79_30670 [Nannocystaceae bacterium]